MMMRTSAYLLLISLMGAWARAAGVNPRLLRVVAGPGGVVKIGCTTEVRAIIEHPGAEPVHGQLVVSCRDGFGRELASTSLDLELPPRSRKEFNLPVLAEHGLQTLEVAIWQGRRRLVHRVIEPTVAALNEGTVLTVGAELLESEQFTEGITLSHGSLQRFASRSEWLRIGRLTDWHALPTLRSGYEGLNALIVTEPPPARWRQSQQRAFQQWLDGGGTLIACAGAAPSAWRASTLSGRLPVQLGDEWHLATLQPLQTLAHADRAIQPPPNAQPIILSRLRSDARVLAGEVSRPLVAWSFHKSTGRVVWLSFDPRREPFRSWNGRTEFWRTLLRWCGGFRGGVYTGGVVMPGSLRPLLQQARVAAVPSRAQLLRPLIGYAVVAALLALYLARRARRKDVVWLVLGLGGTGFAVVYATFLQRTMQQQSRLIGVTTRLLIPGETREHQSAVAEFLLPHRKPLRFLASAGSVASAEEVSLRVSGNDFEPEVLGLAYRYNRHRVDLRVQRPPSWSLLALVASHEAPRAGDITATVRRQGEGLRYRLVNQTRETLRNGRVVVLLPRGSHELPVKYWSRAVPILTPGATTEITLGPATVKNENAEAMAKRVARVRGRVSESTIRQFLLAQMFLYGHGMFSGRDYHAAFLGFVDRAPLVVESPEFRGQWRHLVVAPLPGRAPGRQAAAGADGGERWPQMELHNAELIAATAQYASNRSGNVQLYRGDAVLEFRLPSRPQARYVNVQLRATPRGEARVECAAYNWRTSTWVSWRPRDLQKYRHQLSLDCRHPELGVLHLRLTVHTANADAYLALQSLNVRPQ